MIRFVTVGHVDSGKSTLCGQILLKCKYIDERDFEKIKQKAEQDGMIKWAHSRILDVFEEEQLRGKTHEYNSIDFNYENKQFRLIDTPGHRTYVRSMIEGISSGVDVILVIISMHDKEWRAGLEGGMLIEHIKLCYGAGASRVILVANKMDLIDWNKNICFERLREIKQKCIEIGFQPINIKVVPISALNGIGIIDPIGLPDWYKGGGLMQMIGDTNIINDKEEITVPRKEILVEFKSDYSGIITVGFVGTAYIGTVEIEFEIIHSKQRIIRFGDTVLCWLRLRFECNVYTGMTIILRSITGTIGIGEIKKLKD